MSLFLAVEGRTPKSEQSEHTDETVPLPAFQRAMGRLFHLLRDPVGFDAADYDKHKNNCVTWGEFAQVPLGNNNKPLSKCAMFFHIRTIGKWEIRKRGKMTVRTSANPFKFLFSKLTT